MVLGENGAHIRQIGTLGFPNVILIKSKLNYIYIKTISYIVFFRNVTKQKFPVKKTIRLSAYTSEMITVIGIIVHCEFYCIARWIPLGVKTLN